MHVMRIVVALLHLAYIEECRCLATILIDGQARICNTLAKCDRLWDQVYSIYLYDIMYFCFA